jgi:hypothetical protein|tara:strand:+ start:1370 stop:1693 length:324 start_codon:yes stop_codon:yes gene_type:complete
MPTYDFINTETDEISLDVLMTISDKEQYMIDNPHIKQHYTKVPGIVRSSGTTNVDNHGFKEVLQKVGEGHPMGTVADDHVRLTGKEAKTRDVVKKHAKIQADRKKIK